MIKLENEIRKGFVKALTLGTHRTTINAFLFVLGEKPIERATPKVVAGLIENFSKKIDTRIEVHQTVHDGDCPKCEFPETVHIRNIKTGKILGERCSKRNCDWFVLYK